MDIGEQRKQSCTHGSIIMLCGSWCTNAFHDLFMCRVFLARSKKTLRGAYFAAESRVVDLDEDDTERNRAVNEYSIGVQDFFQLRCRDYLDTVCKDLFKTKYYW